MPRRRQAETQGRGTTPRAAGPGRRGAAAHCEPGFRLATVTESRLQLGLSSGWKPEAGSDTGFVFMTHTKPALHNAMWPGLVGKGPDARAADRARHHARPDGAARGRRRRSSTASTCSSSIRTSTSTPPTTTSRGSPTRSRARGWSSARWSPRSGRRPAAAPRWATRTSARSSSRRSARPAASARSCATSASGPTASSASIRLPARRDWATDPEGNTKKIAETFREACDDRRGPRRAARRRGRNLLGRHAQLEAAWSSCSRLVGRARDARLPGRHGPHAALHARLQRTRGPPPARRITTGRTGRARRRPADADRRAAALDDRLPRRPERRHRERLRLARQDRPPLPAERPQRQARHRPRTPASGCATTTASRRATFSTSAGTAACSPTRR